MLKRFTVFTAILVLAFTVQVFSAPTPVFAATCAEKKASCISDAQTGGVACVVACTNDDPCPNNCQISQSRNETICATNFSTCVDSPTTINLPPTNGTPGAADANKPVTLINPLGTTDPREIIGNLIRAIISIIGSITLLMFVYGGVLWITSMGDDKKVMKGKQILVWCVAGLAIIAGAYALTNAVISGLTTGSVIPTTATGG